ncbi:hypothetical protein JL722_14744 [Aureococcus anophagefferens]|nr:hypothetical protein JL722_14744 [Aureococcus anophagefferens]
MGSGASIATDPTTICLTARGDDRNARRESGDAMRDLVDEVTEENRVATEYVAQRDAHLATVDALYREHVGGGKTLASLIQSELLALREHYEATRDASLMDLMRSELSGEILLFVTKLLAGERDESGDVDEDAAAEAAEKLYEAGEKDWWGTDEAAFVDALLGANPKQCQAINTAYENSHGKSLQKAIKSRGFGTDESVICRALGGDFSHCAAVARRCFEITDASLVDTLVAELGGLFEGDFRFAVTTLVADADKRGRRLQEQVDALGPVDDDDDDALSARLDLLIQCNDATKELIAYEDALAIRRACHGGWTGLGTDEDELVGILARRTKSQLDRIDAQYRALYDTTLRREIEAETSGDFKDMLFEATYDKSLMDLLDDETSGWFEGDFNRIVKAFLVRSEVDDDADADEGAAEEAAAALHDAMKSCLGTDEATVVETLCGARATSRYDEDLDDMLKAKTSGDWGMAVLTWVVGVDPARAARRRRGAAKIEAGEESDEDGSGSEEEEDADSDESGDDDDDDDDDERKERRRANKRKQKKQRGAQEEGEEGQEAPEAAQGRAPARRRGSRAKRLMEDAEAEYGDRLKVPIECAFDEAMYGLQNDCDADDAWREFKKKGFWKGHLLRFKTDDGVFIGALDCRRLLELEGHDPPGSATSPSP